jgi:hypothetical protein
VLSLLVAAPVAVVMVRGGVPLPIDLIARHAPHRAAASALGLSVESAPIQHELATLLLPQRVLVREALAAGRWPHWDPSVHGGMPLAGASQAAPLWPTSLLVMPVPLPLGLGLDLVLRLLVAGLGAFLLARDLGSRPLAAMAAGVGLGLGGFTLFFAMWPLGAAMSTLPWVWLAVRRLVREPGRGQIAALAAALALLLLAGHPETTLHVVTIGVVVGLFELRARQQGRLRVVAAALAAGVLAMAVAGVFLLPVLELLPHSTAWAQRGSEVAPSLPLPEVIERVLFAVVPFRYGPVGAANLDSWPSSGLPWAGASVGGALLVLVSLGLARPGRRFGLIVITRIGLLAGPRAAPLWPLLERLPLFGHAINDRLVALGLLGLALLAARGADQLLEGVDVQPGGLRARLLPAGVVVALVVGIVFTLRAQLLRPEVLGSTILLLVATSIVAAAVAAGARGPWVVGLILTLAAGERWATSWDLVKGRDPRFFALDPPILAMAHEHLGAEPARIVGVGRQLTPNLAGLAGLEDLRGYDPVLLARFEGVRSWSTRLPAWYDRIDDLDHPALDRLGVRLALVPARFRVPPDWRELGGDGSTRLVENTQALARAFVPTAIRINGPPALEDGAGAVASIEIEGAPPAEIGNPSGEVVARRQAPNRLALEVAIPADGWVVVTEPAWPGWRATTAAGEPLELAIADHTFLALRTPAGRHAITLEWRPQTFALGAVLSVVGLATLAALLAAGSGVNP